ncbi:MAG TPA: helix-turn-helix transcriptional regulator [Edaphobacter sp.]|nr:helix-turn-helix transcriptional regulator [Edaphobacter sp.]
MDATQNTKISAFASAIGEPARARILSSLMDGHARTSTELAIIAGVGPSTASAHLHRLTAAHLIKVFVQGKHRYYSLNGPDVAHVLEGLNVLAGGIHNQFAPNTPNRLCLARTCYDHLAGKVAVALHDRFYKLGWLSPLSEDAKDYELTTAGTKAIESLGINIEETRSLRRRFAPACLDWSERRPHIGGALGAALLKSALKRKWLTRDLDSRALAITRTGKREMQGRFGLNI